MRRLLFALLALTTGCAADASTADGPSDEFWEGVETDERADAPADWGKGDLDRDPPYDAPEGLPTLESPEIIVSLEGLTVHLFDRATGFSRVYPTGVGVLGRSGRSITPTGHYATGPDTSNGWYYVASRWDPAYFEGYPFLRLTVENSRGYHTYGFHGPITETLRRDYVSHGCMRMEKDDVVELFTLVRRHPSTPVTIQQELERDAAGAVVDVGAEVTLWAPDEEIRYGASVGPRDDRPVGFVGDACETDADCGRFDGGDGYVCHEAGFCTTSCEGYCPDYAGYATTFCVADADGGTCVPRVDALNAECATVPGTVPTEAERYVGGSPARPATAHVCLPL
ncbi:MAG: L,D-transpeptidase [Myxococcota bacterium]|nr:L,D-transpeptidase [Myxococcota bacterium]